MSYSKIFEKLKADSVGIYSGGDGNKSYLTSPIELLSNGRTDEGKQWCKVFKVTDQDANQHVVKISYDDLNNDQRAALSPLFSNGFSIYENKEDVLKFLQYWPTERRSTTVDKVGWHNHSFVTSAYVVGGGSEEINIQDFKHIKPFLSSGTLDEWLENVAIVAEGNYLLMTGLSASFAAPLLDISKTQNFGIHFHGPSSFGKTNALKLAASVWSSPEAYIQTWRSTGNALEGTGKEHCDILLGLDEIAQIHPRHLSEAIYLLGNGITKRRADKNGEAKQNNTFRTVFLSSGEIPIEQIISQAGETLMGGHTVRLLELEADAKSGFGIFSQIFECANSSELVGILSKNLLAYHGTAGKPYLEYIVQLRRDDEKSFIEKVDSLRTAFKVSCGHSINPQVTRVIDSFSLVAAGGELAIEAGCLPFSPGQASHGVLEAYNAWFNAIDRTLPSDDLRLIEQVRSHFELYGVTKYSALTGSEFTKSIEICGYSGEHNGEPVWFVNTASFKKELCKNFSQKRAGLILMGKGYLTANSDGSPYVSKNIKGKPGRFYVIRQTILNSDS